MTTALFAGSFDPFTIGHADIVTRGLRLFDSVVIAIGVNDKKQPLYTSEERLGQISSFYAEEKRIKVIAYTGLTADIAKEVGATVLLRGIRSGLDYEYERSLADINRCLTGIETVFLFTAQHLSHVSSGAIRELINYGHDVSGMLPPGFVL
ncbi:pantetheine-phosphate adenylyltransferase [Porphyromonas endodontalis]|jgi:pantetheine-phosphate adenylyltransferase|uniref:pantetheine-phosphate adenylyltransferase n=1 Tax=Porphyromonas endodontalis TaxID=28124 RepID=UPI0028EC56DD|nr:pantetheine-phosphate adenylyltransferase [Porphyromonas endodontalis]